MDAGVRSVFGRIREQSSGSLIVVDVQPHDVGKVIRWDLDEFAKFVNGYSDVLVLFNNEDLGWETEQEMRSAYEKWGIDIQKCTFQEKNYGWFREWLDTGFDVRETVKYMINNGIRDSRDIPDDQFRQLLDREELPAGPIYLPTYPGVMKQLRRFDGSDLCGGGEYACLKEVKTLMDAMGLNYQTVGRWTYCGV